LHFQDLVVAIDPLTTATTFATLVSLISDFRNEHNKVAIDDHQKFLEWLSENRHDEIKGLLEQNQNTVTSIKAILNLQSSVFLEKLENIDNKLASLFNSLIQNVSPNYSLSEQSISILRQYESAQASTILEHSSLSDPTAYIFMDGNGGALEYTDPRFIEDDFSMLVEIGLLRLEFGSKGGKLYKLTRVASKLVKSF
jgi:hypothetical protein